MPTRPHLPVMLDQVIDLLAPRPGGTYLDLTIGAGGHARRILERSGPDGLLVGVDRDPQAIALVREELAGFGERLKLFHRPFSRLPEILSEAGLGRVDGLLADLGVSSMQLDQAARGFSFQKSGPLDMRMDPSREIPVSDMIDALDERTLATGLRRFGEVKNARWVARAILRARDDDKLHTTADLARVIGDSDRRKRQGRIHPATRVFMALRMMVNRELEELGDLLGQLPEPLEPGGRAVFISFHSLEDRAVKRRFVELEGGCSCPPGMPVCGCGNKALMKRVNRRAWRADEAELNANPRARSARLRAAERLAA